MLPIKGAQFITYDVLFDSGSSDMLVNPTLAVGDVKVKKDGVSLGNINTLPTVTPAGGSSIKITASATEMAGDTLVIDLIDQTSPKEWNDMSITIDTVTFAEATNGRVDLGAILGVAQSATDLKDFADAGYDPATNKVQGVVTVDGVSGGATAAAQTTAQADLDIITGADGVILNTTQPNYAPNKVVPDVAGTAPTAVENRQEMDANSVDLNQIVSDVAGLAGAAMRGTDGANTVVPDPAGTAPTAIENRQEMDANSALNARTPTAAQLLYMTRHAATAVPVTFSGGTTTTAILVNVDGVAASSTNDVYNSRLFVFNAGTLDKQVCQITAYVGATKTATITAVTTAVTGSHTAVLV